MWSETRRYGDQRAVDDSVVGSAGVDGDAERVENVERVALGQAFSAEEERGRRGLVGEQRGGLGEHRAVEEVQAALLRFLGEREREKSDEVDMGGDPIVVERHVKNGLQRRDGVEKLGQVGVEGFGGRQRGELRVRRERCAHSDDDHVAGFAEIGERRDEVGQALVQQSALRLEERLVDELAGDQHAVVAGEKALRQHAGERRLADHGHLRQHRQRGVR